MLVDVGCILRGCIIVYLQFPQSSHPVRSTSQVPQMRLPLTSSGTGTALPSHDDGVGFSTGTTSGTGGDSHAQLKRLDI